MAENPTLPSENEEPSVEIAPVGEELSPQVADGVEGTTESADESAIREATAAGWVPKEEWKGPAGKWKPANEFLQFRDSVLPLVQKENRSLREQLRLMNEKVSRIEAAENERAQHGEALAVETLKYERQQAQEVGDWAKVASLDDKLIAAAVKTGIKEQVKPVQQNVVAPEIQSAIENFVQNNEWAKDPEMGNVLAETLFTMKQVGSINGLTPDQALERAKDRIKRIYPERFARSRPAAPPAFSETGGFNGSNRGNVRGWNDLKPEVRKPLEDLISATPGLTREGVLKSCADRPTEYFIR